MTKRFFVSSLMALMLVLALCIPGASMAESAEMVTVVDSDGNEIAVPQNPKVVAVYDYAVLDMLETVGFDNTGIETLIVPTKDTLPDALSFYKDQPDDKVVTGGTLFYVDWDVLDLMTPDVVILGARSFGMNGSEERLSSEDVAKLKADTMERYPEAAFVKLSFNSSDSELDKTMTANVAALSAIFPEVADALNEKLAEIQTGMAAINEKAKASGKTALFCMMVDQTTLSVFNESSRFDMLYEEFGFTPVDAESVKWEEAHGFDVRAEYVLEKNPDVIYLLDRSATVGSGAGAENFMNDPIIAKTKAAENGNIYVLDGAAWYTMTGGFAAADAMIADIGQYFEAAE